MKFDHIGVVVPSLSEGREVLTNALEIRGWTIEFIDTINKVFVQFGHDSSGICYELISPLGKDSPVSQALARQKGILNHVAYLVEALDPAAEKLCAREFMIAGPPNPAIAYGGKRIQFFVSRLGFLVELIEAAGHQHKYIGT